MSFLNSDTFKYAVGLIVGWVSLVVGWVLQESSHSLAARRERRKAVALALTDLWGIQYHLRSLNLLVEKFGALPEIPDQMKAQLWVVCEQLLLPDTNELHSRYNQSVTTLSSLDPILGFRLRSKNSVQPIFAFLNSVAAQSPENAMLWLKVQKPILEETDKALREAVLELAQQRGRGEHKQVRERLQKLDGVQKELDDWINLVVTQAKAMMPAAPRAQVGSTPNVSAAPSAV